MASAPHICGSCTRALRQTNRTFTLLPPRRGLSQSSRLTRNANTSPSAPNSSNPNANHDASSAEKPSPPVPKPEPGPMARRLEEATEEVLLTGGRAGKRAIEDAGFSDELKAKLLSKLVDAQFENETAAAFADAGVAGRIPESAGQGTRTIASSQAWTGDEAPEDTILRMLDDARKPLAPRLRGKRKIPTPIPIDMSLKRTPALSPGERAASAQEKAQTYNRMGAQEPGLTQEERDEWRKGFRERFAPGARAMPITFSGLASLANERIEDAIARGQFKNIPRGKGVERDTRAHNPFIDTTEYMLNKMIQRQDISPPWIEKQQELVKAVNNFRSRLRKDWKRHAARTIASRGGSLEEKINRARAYARAEQIHNPRRRNPEQISVPTNATDDVVMVKLRQQLGPQAGGVKGPEGNEVRKDADEIFPAFRPYRDPDWEAHERSYMQLAVGNINAITRSYNLMAPELAKKPYFSLQRELNSCFADVAPQLAETIKESATATPAKSLLSGRTGTTPSGVLERLSTNSVKVYESKAPRYGMREFWKDLWGGGEKKG